MYYYLSEVQGQHGRQFPVRVIVGGFAYREGLSGCCWMRLLFVPYFVR